MLNEDMASGVVRAPDLGTRSAACSNDIAQLMKINPNRGVLCESLRMKSNIDHPMVGRSGISIKTETGVKTRLGVTGTARPARHRD